MTKQVFKSDYINLIYDFLKSDKIQNKFLYIFLIILRYNRKHTYFHIFSSIRFNISQNHFFIYKP